MQTDPRPSSALITVFLPGLRGGGAERAMLLFAEQASMLGHRVQLVVTSSKGELKDVIPQAVEVIKLNGRMRRSIMPLARYLRANRPAALFSTIPHANLAAIIARLIARVPTKVIVRESNSHLGEIKKTWDEKLTQLLIPFIYPLSDGVIAVSNGVAKELRAMGWWLARKTTVAATPAISPSLFRQAAEPLDHPWFAPGQPPVIVGAGRLVPQKDFALLIRAFFELHRTRPCRLLILGEGPLRRELESLVASLDLKDDVSLPGFILNPYPFMKQASVFALSSRYEGMPNVLLQALAFGTPIVSTDCPAGPRECLKEGALGRLVNTGDVHAFSMALGQAIEGDRTTDAAKEVWMRFNVAEASKVYLGLAGLIPSAKK